MAFQFQYQSGGDRLSAVFQILQNYGFQDFLLPFLLFFGLMFAVLQKVNLFQKGTKPDRSINGFIAAAVAGLITVPHVLRMYPYQYDPVDLMYQFLPLTSVAFVVLLVALMFLALALPTSVIGNVSPIKSILGLVAAGIVLVSFLRFIAPGLIPQWLVIDPTIQALGIVIGVMLLVIWFIAGDESTSESFSTIQSLFGGDTAAKKDESGGGGKKTG